MTGPSTPPGVTDLFYFFDNIILPFRSIIMSPLWGFFVDVYFRSIIMSPLWGFLVDAYFRFVLLLCRPSGAFSLMPIPVSFYYYVAPLGLFR
jgi:hypothetical protein